MERPGLVASPPSLRQHARQLQLVAAVGLVLLGGATVLALTAERLNRAVLELTAEHTEAALRAREFRADPEVRAAQRVRAGFAGALAQARVLPAGEAAPLVRALEREAAAFRRLDSLARLRGYSETEGAEGAFRRAAHAIETEVQGARLVLLERDLLALRRHEKDFLLRGRAMYVARNAAAADALARNLAQAPVAEAQRARLAAYLAQYRASFARLVESAQAMQQAEAAFEAARLQSNRTLAALRGRAAWMRWVALVLVGVVGIVCAVGYMLQMRWLMRRVARPLRALHHAARALTHDGALKLPPPHYEEFAGLGLALAEARAYLHQLRHAEAEAARARRSIRAALDSIDDAVLVYDRNHRVRLANPAAAALLGLSQAELQGCTLRAVLERSQPHTIPLYNFSDATARFARALAGETVVSPDLALWNAQAEALGWFSVTYTPFMSRKGVPSGVVARLYDLTRRKDEERALDVARLAAEQARAEAEAAAQFKSAILNNLSHEIRTPLTGLLGYLDLIRDEDFGVPSEYLDDMEASARRLQDTLTGLLNLARLEAGGEAPRPEVVDLRAEAEGAVRVVRLHAERRGLTLSVTVAPDLPPAYVSPVVVRTALNNLLDNALKFTSHGGVYLSLSREEHLLCLTVRDTGVGMDPAFVPRAFEAFEQESSGINRRFQGAGLGLAITKRLVESAGGRISVESTLGEGCCFRVFLPAALHQAAAPVPLRLVSHRTEDSLAQR